jgi:putative ABC transport system permease protein
MRDDIWPRKWLEDAWQDLRFASRLLRKRTGVTLIAALTLALGIGAASSVFSMVHAVLLQPLPYRNPDRLVAIWGHGLREKSLEKIFLPYTDLEEWSRHARSFESLAVATWAFSPVRILTGRGAAQQVLTIPVSAGFFQMLGVNAALGRTFTADDERRGCSVVLSYGFWSTTLGADPSLIGQSLTLDQRPCTVLGVMPANFRFYT